MNKKVVLAGIGGFVLGVLLVGLVGFLMAPNLMMIEDESPLGYEETVQAIQDAAAAQGWKVPAVHAIHKSVNKAGDKGYRCRSSSCANPITPLACWRTTTPGSSAQ